ncbi:hypothetical protein [Pseudoalteromonas sp. G4]|uniref:hypothetical protein n=1 Tax=Pseudoalteromonas sp. G4 TaxID=2992761 RepID=UPI00237E37F4|nr:hypothetical protein [Pseudoalteromonas sp. G4]MDE3271863.1 hypothetical protein [Pseudoalteromonas sp. G4]
MKKIIIILSLACLYIAYLHIKIAELEANNLKLENQLAAFLNSASAALESKQTTTPLPTKTQQRLAFKPSDNASSVKEPRADMIQQVDLFTNTKQSFTEKDIDEQWSLDFSDNLFFFLSYHKELSHLDVKHIDCRETMCKVDIFANESDPIDAARDIAQKLKDDEKFKEHPFYFDSSPDEGVIRIEINRYKQTQ